MKILFTLCFATIYLYPAFISAQTINFDYIKIKGNRIKTTHQAKYKIKINKSFKFLGKFNHQINPGKKQFNVSMAVYSNGKDIIVFHAEAHTDGSGGLDYSNLAPTKLNKVKLTTREQCAAAKDEDELKTNPQIKFIRSKGFTLTTPFYLKQFLATSKDGKAEIVLSYGRSVKNCDSINEHFRNDILSATKKNIFIKRYK